MNLDNYADLFKKQEKLNDVNCLWPWTVMQHRIQYRMYFKYAGIGLDLKHENFLLNLTPDGTERYKV